MTKRKKWIAEKRMDVKFKIVQRNNLVDENKKCRYCHGKLTYKTATLDHIKPKSKGGSNTKENLDIACHECNQLKRSISEGEFINRIKHVDISDVGFIRAYIRRKINLQVERSSKRIMACVS